MNEVNASGSSLSPAQLLNIRKQAEELEGVFLNMLTKEMFASIKGDENFGGIGLADDLMGQMIALQEAANASRGLTQSNIVASTGVYGK